MSEPANAPRLECWKLTGTCAELSIGDLTGAVEVERPGRGVHQLKLAGAPREWNLLRVGATQRGSSAFRADDKWHPMDVYVRGCDLVATYREPLGLPFNIQIYWRAIDDAQRGLLTLEQIISVQTPLWEAYPGIGVHSELASAELHVSNDAATYRIDSQRAYVELSYPGDFTLSGANDLGDGLSEFPWRFGPEFMERGVIRRLRIRGVLSADGAPAPIDELRDRFAASELPLTA